MRALLFAIFSLFAVGAPAEAVDHHAMLKELRMHGVDPAFVGWAEIEPLCIGLMNYKDDPSDYNRCKRDKAVQQATWRADRETCEIDALAITPGSLRNQPQVTIAEHNAGPANDTLTTITTPRISKQELRISRAATYHRCMGDKGWRNPRDWRMGYAE